MHLRIGRRRKARLVGVAELAIASLWASASRRSRLSALTIPGGRRATLGLPTATRACLFDLDGVLTRTAKLHAAAWKETFDEYLRARSATTGRPFAPFDAAHDYELYVDGKLRVDGARSFLASRGLRPGDGEVRALAERKDELLVALMGRGPVEVYEGSVRYVHAARHAGLRTAVVSSSKNCREVLTSAGIADLFDARIDGNVAAERAPRGQAGARHLPGRGARPRRRAGRGGRLRGRARRASRRGGPGTSATSSASTASARPPSCAATAPTSWSPTWPRSWSAAMIQHPVVSRRAVGAARDRARPRRPGADRVAVRAVERPHRPARQPRRGRAARPARHLPQRLLRAAPVALRGEPVRLARVEPDARQRDQRQADAPARRRRAVRRPLRRAARPRPRARLPRRHADAHGRVELAGAAHGARDLGPVRLVHPPRDRRHRLRGRAARRTAPTSSCSRSWWPTSSCPARRRPARRGRASSRRSCPRSTSRATTVAVLIHRTRRSGLRMAAAMDHVVSGTPRAARLRPRRRPTRRASSSPTCSSRGSGCASSSWWPTAGRTSARVPALRDQVAAALEAARTTGWDGLLAEQRALPRRLLGHAPTSSSSGDPELQQAVRFALFQVLSGRRAGRAARHSRQGADRHRLRRPLVLGHRDVHPARADLHRARPPPPTRCAGATRRLPPPGSARASSASAAPRSPGAPSTARSARATGPPAPPPFTSTPTSPTR